MMKDITIKDLPTGETVRAIEDINPPQNNDGMGKCCIL